MNGKDVVNMTIPESVVQGIVKEMVNTQVLAAMSGQEALVKGIVHSAVTRRVDSEGRYSDSSYHTQTLLDYLCTNAIREAAKKAVEAYVESSKELIEKEVRAALKRSTKDLVSGFMSTILEASKNRYAMTVEVKPKLPS